MITIPTFASKNELFKFLVENKNILIAEKRATMKHADGIAFNNHFFDSKAQAYKADSQINIDEIDVLQVRAVINTTNIIDSHLDLHIPGLWDKSLKETGKRMIHLQEHQMQFDKVISDEDDLKAYTELYTWKELGQSFKGSTQALVFDSTVRKERNEYMFKQYAKRRVKNHSVGMWYIKIVMCINDKDYGAEFEAFEKYIEMAVNPEIAESRGYFWAVTEAKASEGSAVVKGSNYVTPTLEIDMKSEPGDHSEEHITPEPVKSTPLNINELLKFYNV
jgi:hypothetical protein